MTDQQIEPQTGPAVTHAFFDRARARLTLDVPPGLGDPTVPVTRGDLDLDPSMWERAGVSATRPAAVLVPVVARIAPGYELTLNASEVADAFEVPLDFLMGPENHQRHSRDWKGIQRQYYAMPYQERYIWGVTAGILRNLYERVYGA